MKTIAELLSAASAAPDDLLPVWSTELDRTVAVSVADLAGTILAEGGVATQSNFASRTDLVTWATTATPFDGQVVTAGGRSYRFTGSGAEIPDLPGWVPFGDISLAHWGANVAGLADAREKLQAAVTYAAGRKLFLAAGALYRVISTASVTIPPEGVRLVAEGADAVIWQDEASTEGAANGYADLFYYSGEIAHIRMENVTLRGSRQALRATAGSVRLINSPTSLSATAASCGLLEFRGCTFEHTRALMFFPTNVRKMVVIGNTFRMGTRGGFHAQNCQHVTFCDNTARYVRDDVLNCNINSIGDGQDFHITGNKCWGSLGLLVTNGKRGTIADNHSRFGTNRFIRVGIDTDADQGSTSLDWVIRDNVAQDQMAGIEAGGDHSMIVLYLPSAQQGSAPGVPGSPDASGQIVAPEPYYYTTGQGLDGATVAPSAGITVSGNVYRRTVISGDFSDVAGELFESRTGPIDITFAMDTCRPSSALRVTGTVRDVRVSENTFVGTYAGIAWNLRRFIRSEILSSVIEGNTFSDFYRAGIWFNDDEPLDSYQEVLVRDNIFDADPYLRHPDRNADGSWLSGSAEATALRLSTTYGWTIEGNLVKNAARVIYPEPAVDDPTRVTRNNVIHADVAATGWNAGNRGVGRVPAVGNGWSVIFRDSDPTSATFRNLTGDQRAESVSMPTTGKWMAGTFVQNINPADDNVIGWKRLTTGSDHVAGVDWVEVAATLSPEDLAAVEEASASASASASIALAARDAAIAGAQVYPDVAAGLAAVADGAQFMVTGTKRVVRHKRNGSVAVEVADYPLASYIDGLITGGAMDIAATTSAGVIDGADTVVGLIGADPEGYAPLSILSDGTVVAPKSRVLTQEIRGALDIGGDSMEGGEGNYQWAITDTDGNVLIGVKDDELMLPASVALPGGGAGDQTTAQDAINRAKSEALARRPVQGVQQPIADFNTIVLYGQSLAQGNESWPALSKTQAFGNLMLGGDVRPSDLDGAGWVQIAPTGLQPLVAKVRSGPGIIASDAAVAAMSDGDQSRGECSAVHMANMASWLLQRRNLVAPNPFIVLNPAVSGKTIGQLSKVNAEDGIDRYSRVTEGVTQAHAAATTGANAGKSHVVTAIVWMQGEWDYVTTQGSLNTTKATYKAALAQLRADMVADIKAITGQTEDPIFMMYQTGASYTRDVDGTGAAGLHVGMAQLEYALENPAKVVLAGPHYQVTDKGGHLDPNGQRWFGGHLAKVFHRVAVEGTAWRPLSPTKIEMTDSTTIRVHFHVPMPPLAFDLPYVVNTATDYAAKGFSVTDAAGAVTVSAAIVGGTMVDLSLSRAIDTATARVWYADKTVHNGNGCLRDSDTFLSREVYKYQTGTGQYTSANIPALVDQPYPLHNWATAFFLPIGYTE